MYEYYKIRNYIKMINNKLRIKNYSKKEDKNLNRKNKCNVWKKFGNNLIKSCLIIMLIFFTENIVKEIVINSNLSFIIAIKEKIQINKDLFSQFLICGISVAGVFLALYYSNISTIYSSNYANATIIIRQLFEYEINNDKNLNKINVYIIQAVILLSLMMIGLPIWYIFIIYMLIKTIDIVISFIVKGNTIYRFSNVYNVLLNSKRRLLFYIDSVTEKGYMNNNVVFQDLYGRKAIKVLNNMEIVNEYILEEKNLNKKDSILYFAEGNIKILEYYLSRKNRILFNSLWFQTILENKKWYSTDFVEKSIAMNTGTELLPKREKDSDWFEKYILKINEKSIKFLIENGCIKEINEYIKEVINLSSYWIEYGNIDLLNKHIRIIVNFIIECKYSKNVSDEYLNMMEIVCYLYVNYILDIIKYIKKIDCNISKKLTKKNYKFSVKKIRSMNNKIFSNKEFLKIYKALKNEKNIEKKVITPNWYLKKEILNLYIIEINKLLITIEKIYNKNLNIAQKLFKEEKYDYSAAFLVNENELYNKIHFMVKECKEVFDELNNNDENNIYLKDMLIGVEKKHNDNIPQMWEDSCEIWGLRRKMNKRDIFGFCYNNLCKFIFINILKFDYNMFEKHYEKLVNLAILSEIDIHDELLIDEIYTEEAKIRFQMSGLNEMFELTGYAIIEGEILNDYRWKKIIDSTIDNIIKKFDQAKRWKNMIDFLVRDLAYFGNMDIGNRKNRFFENNEKFNKLKFEKNKIYGNKKITNSKNLEKLYYSKVDGFQIDMREVFAIACLNKYLVTEDKYKSNTIDIVEWEDIKYDEKK